MSEVCTRRRISTPSVMGEMVWHGANRLHSRHLDLNHATRHSLTGGHPNVCQLLVRLQVCPQQPSIIKAGGRVQQLAGFDVANPFDVEWSAVFISLVVAVREGLVNYIGAHATRSHNGSDVCVCGFVCH